MFVRKKKNKSGTTSGYSKFLKFENDVKVSISEEKIAEDAMWDGLKGYVTNTDIPASEVVSQYSGLWVVERLSEFQRELWRHARYFTLRKGVSRHMYACAS